MSPETNSRSSQPCEKALLFVSGPTNQYCGRVFFCDASFLAKKFSEFDHTLTANNYGLKPPNLEISECSGRALLHGTTAQSSWRCLVKSLKLSVWPKMLPKMLPNVPKNIWYHLVTFGNIFWKKYWKFFVNILVLKIWKSSKKLKIYQKIENLSKIWKYFKNPIFFPKISKFSVTNGAKHWQTGNIGIKQKTDKTFSSS